MLDRRCRSRHRCCMRIHLAKQHCYLILHTQIYGIVVVIVVYFISSAVFFNRLKRIQTQTYIDRQIHRHI